MRSAYWKGLIFGIMIALFVICDTPRAPAEGRYLTLAGPAGFFFMLDRMTGGFRVCPVLGGAVGPGGCCQGLGGGAFIASPLSVWLMSRFSTPTHIGVAETFIVMGAVYFVFMMVGAFVVRVPAPGWKPEGYTPPVQASKLITMSDVHVYDALKTPQFWFIWAVLCINVTAGIGVLGQASAMSQEMFPGKVAAARGARLTARSTDRHRRDPHDRWSPPSNTKTINF